jgi:demethylmenaquinone methyltransferase/2-methoxy-6-polyprenyl-1,4-benzoquinol methylase
VDETDVKRLLAEQRRYYVARAPEYDDWWLRRGRYAVDDEAARDWFADVAELELQLERFAPTGDVLELAAGTGTWTRRLLRYADRVTAVDAVAEVLELNRAKTGGAAEYVLADVFAWEPPRGFDACVFGFWLSHVPSSRFAAFWSLVDRALKPKGRVFLVDNAHLGDPRHLVGAGGEVARRSVADGREFDIVKRFWSPAQLEREVAALGWQLTAGATTNGHFIFASGGRSDSA